MDVLDRITMLLNGKEQQELTNYLNLKKTAYSDWKSGKSESYRKYLIEIANFFNVSIDYLVYGKEKNSSSEDKELSATEKEMLLLFAQLSLVEQAKEIGRLGLIIEQHNAEDMKYKAKEDVS